MSSRVLLAAAALLACACSVDKAQYETRIYSCNPSAEQAVGEGSNICGPGYACYANAHQLGAADFCAPLCQSDDESSACSALDAQRGVALKRCHPGVAGQCPADTFCIRTNLIDEQPSSSRPTDTGVCLPLRSCDDHESCRDPARSLCLSALADTYRASGRRDLKTNSLYCLQGGCDTASAACAPGTACLRNGVRRYLVAFSAAIGLPNPNPDVSNVPDLCVPNCDAQEQCPPNFVCSTKVLDFWKHDFPFCLPAVNGSRCDSDLDCAIGICMEGYRVCAAPCTTNAECTPFDDMNNSKTFACTSGRCLPTDPCDAAHPCAPGLGQVPRSCYQAACRVQFLGLQCASDADCVGGLSCRRVDQFTICTTPCTDDATCRNHPRTFANLAYCDQTLCRPGIRSSGADGGT